ncbi:MAG: Hsp20/alpha crystallin family protein [Bacteriovoracaceae bacterium]|jgi:HSP20 family protein|nr:Hsp20/alpha crystallin family protein [Bacteriovoracaceae bacterium]
MELLPFKSKLFPRWGRALERDFSGLQREMNDVLDTFFGRNAFSTPQIYDMNFYPAVDIQERDDKYLIEAELPGMTEADIDLDFHNNVLTIRGEKKSEIKNKDNGFTHSERYCGSFKRDIPFYDKVNPEAIVAELKKGILHIELSKKEKGKQSHRKIEINH